MIKFGIRIFPISTNDITALVIPSAIDVIRGNWKDPNAKFDHSPKLVLKNCVPSLNCNIPEHGMKLSVSGTKSADFVITHARAVLEGEIWDAMRDVLGSSLVSFVEMAVHPIKLCPSYMNPSDFKKGFTNVTTVLHFGDTSDFRISHPTILQNLEKLRAKKNAKVTLRVEYGEESWGFQLKGILFVFEFTLSDLLHHVKSETPLPLEHKILAPDVSALAHTPPTEQPITRRKNPKNSQNTVKRSHVDEIISMGFTETQATFALRTAGNVEAAIALLVDK